MVAVAAEATAAAATAAARRRRRAAAAAATAAAAAAAEAAAAAAADWPPVAAHPKTTAEYAEARARLGCYVCVGRAGGSERDGFCGRGGGLDPSPYPLPWTWTGRFATRWSAQDGPRRLQERLGEPKMSSKMAQDSLRCVKMAPKMVQEAPRQFQDDSKRPNSLPRRPPRGQNPSKT